MSKEISNVWSIVHNMELSTGVKVGFFIADTWWNKTRIFLYRDENDKGQDLSYFERIFWTFHPNLDVSHPIKLGPQKGFQIDTDLVALIVRETANIDLKAHLIVKSRSENFPSKFFQT